MLPADLHLHSRLCGHAEGDLEDYVERAIALGMPGVGFSFHLPVRIPVPYKVNLTRKELDLAVGQVERLRERYGDRIAILLGGEGDFIPGQEREVEDIAASYPFDYLIGSVHFLRWRDTPIGTSGSCMSGTSGWSSPRSAAGSSTSWATWT